MKRLLTAAMIAALLAYGLPLLTLGMSGEKDKQTEEEAEQGQEAKRSRATRRRRSPPRAMTKRLK